MPTKSLTVLAVVCTCIFFLSAGSRAAKESEVLIGKGATFPEPLYQHWFKVFSDNTGIRVGYKGVGSSKGIKGLLAREVDFGGTDAFLSDEELAKSEDEIVHIPTCVGAVAVSYNLPGNPDLKLTPEILADLFLGKIKNWNDEKIKAVNADVELPDLKVEVIHRSDGSGTSFIFTDYLSKISPAWKDGVGKGKKVNWPTGMGAEKNPGVAGLIKKVAGSIGYVELIYALRSEMPVASIRNRSGNFIVPDLEALSLAAAVDLPDDTRIMITNTSSEKGYPISAFTWLICFREQQYSERSPERARSLVKLLWWLAHGAQAHNEEMKYGCLPEKAVERAEAQIRSITYGGKPVAGMFEEGLEKYSDFIKNHPKADAPVKEDGSPLIWIVLAGLCVLAVGAIFMIQRKKSA